MKNSVYFITGTNTGIGKTYITTSILRHYQQLGFTTLGLKPLASGCVTIEGNLYNEDALAIIEASSIKLAYTQVNPLRFLPPIAPHIAAQAVDIQLTADHIVETLQPALSIDADITLIEGVGGWLVPINTHQTMADVVKLLDIPVILVVGLQLGCLNHAILTYHAIAAAGLHCVGWIANCLESDMLAWKDNIATLQQWLAAPCLAIMPYGKPEYFSHDLLSDLTPDLKNQ